MEIPKTRDQQNEYRIASNYKPFNILPIKQLFSRALWSV
jgi:hypothetical protein